MFSYEVMQKNRGNSKRFSQEIYVNVRIGHNFAKSVIFLRDRYLWPIIIFAAKQVYCQNLFCTSTNIVKMPLLFNSISKYLIGPEICLIFSHFCIAILLSTIFNSTFMKRDFTTVHFFMSKLHVQKYCNFYCNLKLANLLLNEWKLQFFQSTN